MNNIVDIIYTKHARFPQIAINGEKISRYMELSDLIYDDMFNWVDKLYESMDDELCESYTVCLTGHPLHYRILKSAKDHSTHCSAIRFTPIEYRLPIVEKLSYAKELNLRYHLGIRWEADSIRFCSDEPARFQDVVNCSDGPDNYFITAGSECPAASHYCVRIADEVRFQRKRGVSYIEAPEHLLPELTEYFNLYHLYLKFIDAVFSAAKDMAMSQEEALKFEAYLNEEYRVYVNELPDLMDRGNKCPLTYTYYPQCFEDPQLTARSSNPAVIFVSNNTLIAQGGGTANIQLVDKNGAAYRTFTVNVSDRNYITNISIVLPATSMRINETLRFKCLLSPNNADDADSLRYTVSDESVVAFSGQNELYGLAAGRVCITVSTPRVSKSFYVSVLPPPKDIILPVDQLELPLYADAHMECRVSPFNASPMPAATWQSSNPRVVSVTSTGNYACKLTSLNPGKANLVCQLEGTNIRKTIPVEVPASKGCYVATSVYGSYDCPQVWVLRRYRDQFLASHALGRAFIKVYYALSPTAVTLFGKTKWFNKLWRGILDSKIRKLKERGYEDTPYND